MLALSVLPGGSGRLQGSNLRASDVKIAKPLVYDGNKLTLLVKGKPYSVPPLVAASKDPWVVKMIVAVDTLPSRTGAVTKAAATSSFQASFMVSLIPIGRQPEPL